MYNLELTKKELRTLAMVTFLENQMDYDGALGKDLKVISKKILALLKEADIDLNKKYAE